MAQDFLIVEGVTVAGTLSALISQISELTVSNFKRKTIKWYAHCMEIKLHLYLTQDVESLKKTWFRKKLRSVKIFFLWCAKSLTDNTIIDNIRGKEKSRRRPDGHCFEAVKLLQKTHEQEDCFLLYSYSNSATLPYVIKSSRLKLVASKSWYGW